MPLKETGGVETELRERLDAQVAYSIDLQRIIECLCHGVDIRPPETGARHHYDMAVAYRAKQGSPE